MVWETPLDFAVGKFCETAKCFDLGCAFTFGINRLSNAEILLLIESHTNEEHSGNCVVFRPTVHTEENFYCNGTFLLLLEFFCFIFKSKCSTWLHLCLIYVLIRVLKTTYAFNCKPTEKKNPSIHHLYYIKGHGKAGANQSSVWARGRVHPGQVSKL